MFFQTATFCVTGNNILWLTCALTVVYMQGQNTGLNDDDKLLYLFTDRDGS